MPARKVSDEQLLELLRTTTSTTQIANMVGMSPRGTAARLRALGVPPQPHAAAARVAPPPMVAEASGRLRLDMPNGRAVVFSDAHFKKDAISTANRALVKLLPELKPSLVVCNGDALDGASISRHGPIPFDVRPTAAEELRACDERMEEIADAARGAKLVFTLGNHDIRLHAYLASQAPQLIDLPALDLRVLFPRWKVCWSAWVNDNTIIKHRHRGGQYAVANNVRAALGKSFVTGHLHSLKCIPLSSYAHEPTSYGVDTGMLADPEWDSFAYREDGPADWRSGFVVLTWRNGRLLFPELVVVHGEGLVEWRGEIISV